MRCGGYGHVRCGGYGHVRCGGHGHVRCGGHGHGHVQGVEHNRSIQEYTGVYRYLIVIDYYKFSNTTHFNSTIEFSP